MLHVIRKQIKSKSVTFCPSCQRTYTSNLWFCSHCERPTIINVEQFDVWINNKTEKHMMEQTVIVIDTAEDFVFSFFIREKKIEVIPNVVKFATFAGCKRQFIGPKDSQAFYALLDRCDEYITPFESNIITILARKIYSLL